MNTQPLALRDFAGTIEITLDAQALKAVAIQKSREVIKVTDDNEQSLAVALLRDLKSIRVETEAARKSIKAPVLALGKKIDQTAEDFMAEIEKEERRLSGHVNHFQQKLLEARRAAEEAAERDRRRLEWEAEDARRKAEEAARQGDIAAAKKLAEEAFEQELEAEITKEEIAEPEQPKGLTAKEAFDYQVLGSSDADQHTNLVRFAAAHPNLVKIEIRRRDLLDQINAELIKDAPGIRIYKVLKTQVR